MGNLHESGTPLDTAPDVAVDQHMKALQMNRCAEEQCQMGTLLESGIPQDTAPDVAEDQCRNIQQGTSGRGSSIKWVTCASQAYH